MENYIQISKINDFIFCPKSIYFHGVFENFDEKLYHDTPQTVGRIKHEIIDNGEYSSLKKFLQGIDVYSDKYGLCGKIDLFDTDRGELIERKYFVKEVFEGYKFQLYAQYFALEEMGYCVKKMFIHSLKDNVRYEIPLPDDDEIHCFEKVVEEMKRFKIEDSLALQINENKCAKCIYKSLCH